MRFAKSLPLIATAPLLVGAVQPVHIAPSSPWEVNYAENSCRLNRIFGTGDQTVLLSLESVAPGLVDMVAVGKPLAGGVEVPRGRFLPVQTKPMDAVEASSANGPAVRWRSVALLPDDVVERQKREADAGRKLRGVRPPALDLAQIAQDRARHQDFAKQSTAIEITTRRSRPVVLDTGSLGAAIKAFDKCNRDSLREWGVDPDLNERIVRPAWSPDTHKWFGPEDYPSNMARKGEQAEVSVRLLIDAAGRPTRCTGLTRFKEKSFNDAVCAVFMRRAHFAPAELADGTKVPDYYINNVVFILAN